MGEAFEKITLRFIAKSRNCWVFFNIIETNEVIINIAFDLIRHRKLSICLELYGQVSRQPKRCRSAMLDLKGRAFCHVSGSLYTLLTASINCESGPRNLFVVVIQL